MYNNLSNINEASSYKKLSVIIDNIELNNNDIVELEIHWEDDFRVHGILKFNDLYDFSNSSELDDSKIVKIYVNDLYDDFYSRDFKIINISEKKVQNNKITKIEFQDNISWALQNTFLPKSYVGVTLTDILEDNISIVGDMGSITKKIINTTLIHDQYVIPGSINFLDFFINECNKEGLIFYQSRKSVILEYAKNLIPNNLEVVEFDYKENNSKQHYGFNIIDYTVELANTKRVNSNPKHKVIAYNPSTKTMDEFSQNLDEIYTDIQVTGKNNTTQQTNGECIKSQVYLIDDNLFLETMMSSKDNTGINIMVPGNILYSNTFKKMNIFLMGNRLANSTIKEGDIKLSGEYVCYKVKDKFIQGQKFIQQLILKRVDLGAK